MASYIIELTYNLALLVALSVVSGFIRQLRGAKVWEATSQGMLFGGATVIGMMRPLVLGPGLIFDGRSVMISLCGLFFGPVAVAVAGGMALVYRLFLGGQGTTMGVLVIISSALIGLIFHRRWILTGTHLSTRRLLGLGLLVHGAMVLLMLTLPEGTSLEVIKRLGLPILLAYPLATLLIGKVLFGQATEIRTTEALRESEERMRLIMASSSDAIYGIDTDGRCTFANQACLELLGYDQVGDLLGCDMHALIHYQTPDLTPLPNEDCLIYQAFRDGENVTVSDDYFWRKDGHGIPVEYSSSPIRKDGQIVGAVVIWRDITERKQAEQAMQKQTEDLRSSNARLSAFNRVAVDRELRMIEMKREVDALRVKLGEPPRYRHPEDETA